MKNKTKNLKSQEERPIKHYKASETRKELKLE